jgi:hypothetical protein
LEVCIRSEQLDLSPIQLGRAERTSVRC